MSELLVSTLRDRATNKSIGAERVVEGVAKSRATISNRDASASITTVVRESFNLSSISDGGLGITSLAFTSPFKTAWWSSPTGQQRASTFVNSGSQIHGRVATGGTFGTNENGTYADQVIADYAAFGDLA